MLDPERILTDENDLNMIPALSLAYIGDGVYELLVRAHLISGLKLAPKKLHNSALSFVSAPAQADAIKKILPYLTDEETSVLKRGRNAKVNSVPHNATIEQYHMATALETLFGYLYLKGENERIDMLFSYITGEDNAV